MMIIPSRTFDRVGRWWQKRANCSDKAVRLREEVILGPVVWGLTSVSVRLVRRQTTRLALLTGPKVPEVGRLGVVGVFFVLVDCSQWERGKNTCPDLQS